MKLGLLLWGVMLTLALLVLDRQHSHRDPSDASLSVLTRLDYLLYDWRLQWLLPPTQQASPPSIVIVDIDESSLEQVGRWPWSRSVIADLVGALQQRGVVMLGLDVVLAEPEANPAARVLAFDSAAVDAQRQQQWLQYFDADTALAKQLAQIEVVTGYFFHQHQSRRNGQLPTPLKAIDNTLEPLLVPSMPGYSATLPVLQKSALSSGFLTVLPDQDGVLRRVPLVLEHNQHVYTSLSLEVARQFLLLDSLQLQTSVWGNARRVEGLWLDRQWLPTNQYGQLLVPYVGGAKSFPYVSAAALLDNPAVLPEGADIVLLGTSAMGLSDLRSTPVGIGFPGVEVHANVIEALLTGRVGYTPDWALGFRWSLLVVLGVALSLLLPKCKPVTMICVVALAGVMLLAAYLLLWQQWGINVAMVSPLLLVLLLGGSHILSGFVLAGRQKKQIMTMFGQYVAPQHIHHLLNSTRGQDSFAGETKDMTVLFSDIRGFTRLSEQLSATELKQLLNHFFTPMTEVIFSQGGTIDKYVGDMVMAFWGAPLDDDCQALHAVTAAMQMLQQAQALQTEFQQRGWPPVNIGIGINTGSMNVGDMGSTYRRAYTVLGDAVNLGSRLESITKFYGVGCLISEDTYWQLQREIGICDKPDEFVYRCVDRVKVVGKETAIDMYQPLWPSTKAACLLTQYAEARAVYLQQRWLEARDAFMVLEQADQASSVLYRVYLSRIEQFLLQPPPVDWDGTFYHTHK